MSHTKGEWKVMLFPNKEQNHEIWVQTREGFKVVAAVCKHKHTNKEVLANTHLIKASPVLLTTMDQVKRELIFMGKKHLVKELGIEYSLKLARGLK